MEVTESSRTPGDRGPGAVTLDHTGTERVWRAGRLPPMPIRRLPEAPQAAHIIGPAMILVALGVGLGETFLWPRLVIVFGPNIRWMFLVGVALQTVVMLEMARYAMATGESIFFGAARIWQPIMWLFFVTAIAVYIWPGHISTGADALESLTGIPWQLSASVGLIVIGLMFTVVKFVYNIVEAVLAFLVGVLVIGSAIVAAIVGSLSDLGDTLVGLVRFDFGVPHAAVTAAWFPILVGSIAFAGPSGMQQMWYTLWLRDKGVGLFDAFARGQSDMTYYFVPGAKKLKMAHLYGLFLWGVIIFGVLIINFGPVDGPTGILNVLAFMSTFVMGAYCLTLAAVNRRNLPKKIRPNPIITVVLVLGGIAYLGMLFYSMIKFGVTDLG